MGEQPKSRFMEIIRICNPWKETLTSMHQALFAKKKDGTMHFHNVVLVDDSWYKRVEALVLKWLCSCSWQLRVDHIVQLVSFLHVFSGDAVLWAVEAIGDPSGLPILQQGLIHEQEERMLAFLSDVLKAGGNPFSIRTQRVLRNACVRPKHKKCAGIVQAQLLTVLTREEAASLSALPSTYTRKLKFLSRKPGYTKQIDKDSRAPKLIERIISIGCTP